MRSKKFKKIFIVCAGLFCALVVSTLVISRQAVASVLIGVSDFKEIAPEIYIEQGMSSSEIAQFLALYKEAKARISSTYGEYSAQPVIIVGHTEKMLRYGNGFGTSHFLPGKSYVVIGQNGRTVDVVAHELVHVELVYRTGYWKRMTQIPAWFEEGVAMQVDYRKPFDLENFSGKTRTSRDKLWSQAQFNSGGGDAVMLNYAWSKEMVRAWRLGQPKNRVYELLKEISQGKKFEDAFAASGS